METAQTTDELKARVAEAERQERRQQNCRYGNQTNRRQRARSPIANSSEEDMKDQLGRKQYEVESAWNQHPGTTTFPTRPPEGFP